MCRPRNLVFVVIITRVEPSQGPLIRSAVALYEFVEVQVVNLVVVCFFNLVSQGFDFVKVLLSFGHDFLYPLEISWVEPCEFWFVLGRTKNGDARQLSYAFNRQVFRR